MLLNYICKLLQQKNLKRICGCCNSLSFSLISHILMCFPSAMWFWWLKSLRMKNWNQMKNCTGLLHTDLVFIIFYLPFSSFYFSFKYKLYPRVKFSFLTNKNVNEIKMTQIFSFLFISSHKEYSSSSSSITKKYEKKPGQNEFERINVQVTEQIKSPK